MENILKWPWILGLFDFTGDGGRRCAAGGGAGEIGMRANLRARLGTRMVLLRA
jgi:hypothetical protein